MWNSKQDALETVSWLLRPHSIDEFAGVYYERAPLHIRRDRTAHYGEFFSLAELERVLYGSELAVGDVLVYRDGLPARRESYLKRETRVHGDDCYHLELVDPDRVSALFALGCTLVFDKIHAHSASLAKLCRGMEAFFGHRVNANVYLTPPNSQGFTAHYDTHDTVILQIEGKKDWLVYGPVAELPLQDQLFNKRTQSPGEVRERLALLPGDLLYLPRGVAHEAKSSDVLSLHVTIGLYPVLVVDVLREALGGGAEVEAFLRQSASRAAFDAKELTEVLARTFEPDRLAAALAKLRRTYATERRNELDGQLSQLARLDELSVQSIVAVRSAALYALDETDQNATLSFSGKTVKLPKAAGALVRRLDAGPTRVADLLEGDAGALDIVRRLIQEGFAYRLETEPARRLSAPLEELAGHRGR